MLLASSQAATPTAVAWIIAADAVGQTPTDARRQSDELLRQARRALKDGQYDRADGLIVEAEKLGVRYDSILDKFADTPAQVKKLAAEERAKAKGGVPKPSSLFPAFMQPGEKPAAPPAQPPADPFAARNARENTVDKITGGGAPQNNPTQPFLMSPNDMAAKDQQGLPLLPNGSGPPGFANGSQPAGNPYALPQENNPLARGAELPDAPQPFTPPSFGPAPNANANGPGPQPGLPGTADQFAGLNMPAAPTAGRPDEAPQRLPTPAFTPGSNAAGNTPEKKAEALRLIAEAKLALDKGDLNTASTLAKQADGLRVPDAMFAPTEIRPWQVLLDVDRAVYRNQGVTVAGGQQGPGGPKFPVQTGAYNQGNAEPSRIQPAAAVSANLMRQNPEAIGGSHPMRLYDEGVKALEAQDRDTAMRKFTEAWKSADQLDPEMRAALKDKLTFLRAANAPAQAAQPLPRPEGPAQPIQPGTSPALEAVGSQQEVARQRLQREFSIETKAAEQVAQKDPKTALAKIKAFRERVVNAEVDTNARKNLLTMVDKRAAELQTYIDNNKSSIENAEKNRAVLADRARGQELTYEMQEKLASLVEQFNKLMDDRRYAEAVVIAKQARELAPNDPVTVSMVEKGALAVGIAQSESTKRNKEDYFRLSLQDVDNAGAGNVGDDDPIVFGNSRRWSDLTRRRRGLLESRNRLSPAEMEIQKSLSKPVELNFENRPLNEVVNVLSQMTGVNIYLDPQGLHAEGVTVDTPVSIKLNQPISLKSALTLLLGPLRLSFVIQNEVLRVTSQQTRDSNVYAKVYYVADLVIPIPNFTPTYNMGIAGALKESLSTLGYGGNGSPMGRAPLTIAKNDTSAPAGMNPTILGQQSNMNEGGLFPTASSRNPHAPGGPGGMGGGVQADFDPLIDLITSTIEPDSWQDVGGPGSISGFDTNLSLVVSQRQDIHERIADLLEQLRRLQDLQVTIEVRFITVSDRFFERIGIDFDFNIDDNTHLNRFVDQIPTSTASAPLSPFDDDFKSFAVGLTPTGPTADLDYRFSNGGFVTAIPQFGGFDAGSAANFGFAILSDIEVFFLLQAAQGDDRTNVLQAPKVTLFNGQQATIIDSSFRPFVTSVVPVVGDFAAAYQPVIVVLSEGTMMSVQAVVSADRRFVRLTLVPFFSQIGDVETFTFTGSVTTNSGQVVQDPSNPDNAVPQNVSRTVSGTTVQLPTLATTTVTTTVSVPDGGTVLLGGIKRLREGRVERGLPLVSKIPYVSRLFTNVGIGRDAQSLMMMVTPRIIIQEEEEEKLGIDFDDAGK